jgi:hypothetical protein
MFTDGSGVVIVAMLLERIAFLKVEVLSKNRGSVVIRGILLCGVLKYRIGSRWIEYGTVYLLIVQLVSSP